MFVAVTEKEAWPPGGDLRGVRNGRDRHRGRRRDDECVGGCARRRARAGKPVSRVGEYRKVRVGGRRSTQRKVHGGGSREERERAVRDLCHRRIRAVGVIVVADHGRGIRQLHVQHDIGVVRRVRVGDAGRHVELRVRRDAARRVDGEGPLVGLLPGHGSRPKHERDESNQGHAQRDSASCPPFADHSRLLCRAPSGQTVTQYPLGRNPWTNRGRLGRRSRPRNGRGVRRLGREDALWAHVHGDPPLDLRDRPRTGT